MHLPKNGFADYSSHGIYGELDTLAGGKIIPKGEYTDISDFSANASDEEIVGFNRAVAIVADKLGISEQSGGNGYRLIANAGKDSHQEVPHLHFHLFGGENVGKMVQ